MHVATNNPEYLQLSRQHTPSHKIAWFAKKALRTNDGPKWPTVVLAAALLPQHGHTTWRGQSLVCSFSTTDFPLSTNHLATSISATFFQSRFFVEPSSCTCRHAKAINTCQRRKRNPQLVDSSTQSGVFRRYWRSTTVKKKCHF